MDDVYIGTILMWPITYAPEGFVFCQGQQLLINQYQALYSLLGIRFGGNATTNFNVPDFRGRVPLGTGQSAQLGTINLAQVCGNAVAPATSNLSIPFAAAVNTSNLQATGSVTLAANQIPAHTHTTNAQVVSVAIPASSGTVATTLTNDPTNNNLAQGTATTLANNQAKVYTTGSTNVTLAPFNLTLQAGNTGSTGVGQPVGITLPISGTATVTGNAIMAQGSLSTVQPSLGIGFIIATMGIYPVNPN